MTNNQQHFYDILVSGGVPDIYAFMATCYINDADYLVFDDAASSIAANFDWMGSAEGVDFWYGIYEELRILSPSAIVLRKDLPPVSYDVDSVESDIVTNQTETVLTTKYRLCVMIFSLAFIAGYFTKYGVDTWPWF